MNGNNSLSRHASWGQFELLMKPNKNVSGNSPEEYTFRGGPPYGSSNVNYESAISFLKKENKNLKSPIF